MGPEGPQIPCIGFSSMPHPSHVEEKGKGGDSSPSCWSVRSEVDTSAWPVTVYVQLGIGTGRLCAPVCGWMVGSVAARIFRIRQGVNLYVCVCLLCGCLLWGDQLNGFL